MNQGQDSVTLLTYEETARRLGCAINTLYNQPRLRKKLGFRYVPDVGMRTTPENLEVYKRGVFEVSA